MGNTFDRLTGFGLPLYDFAAIEFLCGEIDKLREPNELKTLSAELLSTKLIEATRLENAELRSIIRHAVEGKGSMSRCRELIAEWDRQEGRPVPHESVFEDEGDDA